MRKLWLSGLSMAVGMLCLTTCTKSVAQTKEAHSSNERCYWQQEVEYEMEIDVDAEAHRYDGFQRLTYTNHSPDTLFRVFYHLYFNAFQPGSMMDVRSRTIEDPDRRVGGRIAKLEEEEQGYIKVETLQQDGKRCAYETVGTVLEVELDEPIPPNSSTVLTMDYKAQVPLQIRRSGRDNREGIALSMSQWYPKMAEFDREGWHANPYVGREFYGVWGDFDVKITIDSSYTLGGTGYLQNPQECGHGYEDPSKPLQRPSGDKITWHFEAPNVHDFMWAGDPDYTHDIVDAPNGPRMHFIYQKDSNIVDAWKKLPSYMAEAFEFMSKNFGPYGYDQYSFIQGGDGGMEYPMATLVTGERGLQSLVGVCTHEMIHSWYYGMLATNESLYAWMDEGFTTYATSLLDHKFFGRPNENPFGRSYNTYYRLKEQGKEEALDTHADHFETNRAYGIGSYSKGCIFLHQLSYVIGKKAFDKGMLRYHDQWAYKHPTPQDFKRVMEKVSRMELDWYFRYWINTTHEIDYAIESVAESKEKAVVTLSRKGGMPMPLDVMVTFSDGSKRMYYVPLRIMRNEKPAEKPEIERVVKQDWPWTHPQYRLVVETGSRRTIESIEIDPSERMADVDRENNIYPIVDLDISAGDLGES